MFGMKSILLVCSYHFLSEFLYVGDKFSADLFKNEIIPLLKTKGRLKFVQDVSLNNARYKVNQYENYHINYLRKILIQCID